MDKKYLEKFYTSKKKIKLNLKNGKFYTGIIIELTDTNLIFRDKYGNDLPFDLKAISYVDIVNGSRGDVDNE